MRRQAATRPAGTRRADEPPAFSSSGPVHLAPVDRRFSRIAGALLAGSVLLVLLAMIKPWGDVGPPPSSGSVVGDWIDAALPDPTPRRVTVVQYTPPPLEAADLAAAELCRWPSGWRVFAHQEWLDTRARVWTAVQPIRASEPGDPRIPLVRLRSTSVPLLGFCAPIDIAEAWTPSASTPLVRAWRVEDGGTPEPIRLALVDPPDPSALGSLWVPLDGGRALPSWPPGRYVFRIATGGAGADDGSWWAVEVGLPG